MKQTRYSQKKYKSREDWGNNVKRIRNQYLFIIS